MSQVAARLTRLVACVPVSDWPVRVWAKNVGASVWPRPMADLIAALSAARIIVSTFPDTVTSGIKLWDQVKGESVWTVEVAAVGLDVSVWIRRRGRTTPSRTGSLPKQDERNRRPKDRLKNWFKDSHWIGLGDLDVD